MNKARQTNRSAPTGCVKFEGTNSCHRKNQVKKHYTTIVCSARPLVIKVREPGAKIKVRA